MPMRFLETSTTGLVVLVVRKDNYDVVVEQVQPRHPPEAVGLLPALQVLALCHGLDFGRRQRCHHPPNPDLIIMNWSWKSISRQFSDANTNLSDFSAQAAEKNRRLWASEEKKPGIPS